MRDEGQVAAVLAIPAAITETRARAWSPPAAAAASPAATASCRALRNRSTICTLGVKASADGHVP